MIVLITLTTAGVNTGPFNLFASPNGLVYTQFATGIPKDDLVAGYTSTVVPDGSGIIRVTSVGDCTNSIDLLILGGTTTTTTTLLTTSTTTTLAPGSCCAPVLTSIELVSLNLRIFFTLPNGSCAGCSSLNLQSSTDNITWTNSTQICSSAYLAAAGPSVPTYFRIIQTCVGSLVSSPSNVVLYSPPVVTTTTTTTLTPTTTTTTTAAPTVLRFESYSVEGTTGGSSSISYFRYNLGAPLGLAIAVGEVRVDLYDPSTLCSVTLGSLNDISSTVAYPASSSGVKYAVGEYTGPCSDVIGWTYRANNNPSGTPNTRGIEVSIDGATAITYYDGEYFYVGGTKVTVEITHITPGGCSGFANCI